MTSGEFHSIPLDSITVNREARQRRELTGIAELADSINALGLINPVVVTRDLVLVAGERRLEACRTLGWTAITAQYVDEVPLAILHRLELEENTRRVDLTWQDRTRAIEAYHELRRSEDPNWSQEATAQALNLSDGSVADNLSIARELKTNPQIAKADKFSVARNMTKRAVERRLETITSPTTTEISDVVLNVSFLEWAPTYSGSPFNLIHCDFPYGINADHIQQGYQALEHGGYADSPDVYFNLLQCFADNLDRFCAPSAHLVFWFSMKYYAETLKFFAEHTDFVINPTPLIWFKSDNTGILPDPSRGPRQVYETAFLGSRGDRKIVQAVANVFPAPSPQGQHMSEKSQPMLEHFFRMLVDDTTSLLDPTCGSASALRAARALGCRNFLGLELNPDFAQRAIRSLA